jgi:hypothetical protein
MSDKQKLSTQEWQLLSAYLDDQLFGNEKRQAEKLLTSRSDCQAALEELKRLQILLRYLPVRRVPRNFTISAGAAARPRMSVFNLILRVSSAITAALLGFALALDYLPALRPLAAGLPSDKMRAVEPATAPSAEMALKSADEEPEIIYWGGPPALGAYGKGGGGAEGMGGAPSLDYGIGGGLPEAGMPAPEMPLPEVQMIPPEDIPEGERLPTSELEEMPAELEMVPEIAPEIPPEARDSAPAEREALKGSAPILGVRPPDEQGRVEISSGQFTEVETSPDARPLLRIIQIILAVLLVLTAIPAWLLRRR